jgi:hypothetical protein
MPPFFEAGGGEERLLTYLQESVVQIYPKEGVSEVLFEKTFSFFQLLFCSSRGRRRRRRRRRRKFSLLACCFTLSQVERVDGDILVFVMSAVSFWRPKWPGCRAMEKDLFLLYNYVLFSFSTLSLSFLEECATGCIEISSPHCRQLF